VSFVSIIASREVRTRISRSYTMLPFLYNKYEKVGTTMGHAAHVYCLAFDRTGRRVFTGADDNLIKVWSSDFCVLIKTLRGHQAELVDLAVSPDNTQLASGDTMNTIRVWSLKNWENIAVLRGHTAGLTSVSFNPFLGLPCLASTSSDGTSRLWDATDYTKLPKILRKEPYHELKQGAWSPTGLHFASVGDRGQIHVWAFPSDSLENPTHLDCFSNLNPNSSICTGLQWSSTGNMLLTWESGRYGIAWHRQTEVLWTPVLLPHCPSDLPEPGRALLLPFLLL
jgi:WD40 repeat protein